MGQTQSDNQYEKQQRISFLGFLAELPNYIAVTVSAIFSGSLLVGELYDEVQKNV